MEMMASAEERRWRRASEGVWCGMMCIGRDAIGRAPAALISDIVVGRGCWFTGFGSGFRRVNVFGIQSTTTYSLGALVDHLSWYVPHTSFPCTQAAVNDIRFWGYLSTISHDRSDIVATLPMLYRCTAEFQGALNLKLSISIASPES
jgi:hypothetical protein